MSELNLSLAQVDGLLAPRAIRMRAAEIFALANAGKTHFKYHPELLGQTVDFVLETIRKNYPDLKIPFHSRWGHFRAGGVDRVKLVDQKIAQYDSHERARIKLDLVITSVLLDAGAGMSWRFTENNKAFARSEGLGIASLHMFLDGGFSSRNALRADQEGLARVDAAKIEKYFQVSSTNPLVGVEGRALLLKNLASALRHREIFKDGRPGNILDALEAKYGRSIPAVAILRAVLDGLGPIWPGRLSAQGRNLGDVWRYEHVKGGLVPFHKLSQWMTYSLIEPILEAGFEVSGVHELTGLAEYRNGGLILDSGLVELRNPQDIEKTWRPESELIIEWRALTVHLLDEIGAGVRRALGKSEMEFPLAKVLEGGTWWAGRRLAQEKRADGGSPLKLESDGTVF